MKLFAFPQAASDDNGYGIVVKMDYQRLMPNENDSVIWYTNSSLNDKLEDSHFILSRPTGINLKRLWNVIRMRPSSEVRSSEINGFINSTKLEYIFCGDTIFYRALRANFPNSKIYVRFHNCFYRINERLKMINFNIDLKFFQVLWTFTKLEKVIFKDKNAIPIFLCEEDLSFYNLLTGRNDALLWPVPVDQELQKNSLRKVSYSQIDTIVYFGGVDTHKKKSLDIFIDKILPEIKRIKPNIRLELFGMGTEFYENKKNVIAHGRYEGDQFPFIENGLYINPDLTGGGVKIKIKTYIEAGLRFISTPFGFEGYPENLIDQKTCWVSNIESWKELIPEIIDNSG